MTALSLSPQKSNQTQNTLNGCTKASTSLVQEAALWTPAVLLETGLQYYRTTN